MIHLAVEMLIITYFFRYASARNPQVINSKKKKKALHSGRLGAMTQHLKVYKITNKG